MQEHASQPPGPIDWNLHRLRIFLAVATWRSFTEAGRELSIAQPAVSHQVKSLERQLGVRLFERRGRTVELTDVGQVLLETARDVVHRLDDGARAMAEVGAGLRGSVAIAADTTSGIYVVPMALGAFHVERPAIEITLHVENRRGVIRRLTDRECDLAVMADPPRDLDCDVVPFVVDRLVVVAAPTHPLAGRARIDDRTLTDERFLVREPGSGTRGATERFFARAGRPLSVGMELGSTGAIKQAVAAGLGIAVVSRWAIDLELGAGRLVVLDAVGFPIERRWSIVDLRDRRRSTAAGLLRSFLTTYGESRIIGGDDVPGAGRPVDHHDQPG
jgi:DNA-binding transcriptional LysR family regulator